MWTSLPPIVKLGACSLRLNHGRTAARNDHASVLRSSANLEEDRYPNLMPEQKKQDPTVMVKPPFEEAVGHVHTKDGERRDSDRILRNREGSRRQSEQRPCPMGAQYIWPSIRLDRKSMSADRIPLHYSQSQSLASARYPMSNERASTLRPIKPFAERRCTCPREVGCQNTKRPADRFSRWSFGHRSSSDRTVRSQLSIR